MASILLARVVEIAIPLIGKNRRFLCTDSSLLLLASSDRSGSSFTSSGFFWVRLPFHKLTIKGHEDKIAVLVWTVTDDVGINGFFGNWVRVSIWFGWIVELVDSGLDCVADGFLN